LNFDSEENLSQLETVCNNNNNNEPITPPSVHIHNFIQQINSANALNNSKG